MQKNIRNLFKLVSTPEMLPLYIKWQLNRLLLNQTPSIVCSNRTKAYGWLNFSEYWSFHNGIPDFERLFFEKFLQKSMSEPKIAFDVGANFGLFTLALADIEGLNTLVHSFEPIPSTFDRLQSNIDMNKGISKRVLLNLNAIGLADEVLEFQIFDKSPAINKLIIDKQKNSTISTQKVTVTSLDNYCGEQKINHIDFLKIDVEGMEVHVLKGAKNLLRKKSVSMILLEICPDNLLAVGSNIDNLYNTIMDFDYTPRSILKNGEAGAVLNLDDLRNIKLANIAVMPNS